MISEGDEKIIYDFIFDKIDENEFYRNFSVNLKENPDYFKNEWLEAIKSKNGNQIEIILDIEGCFDDRNYKDFYIPYIRLIIEEKWHHLHEKFIDILRETPDVRNVDIYGGVLHTVYEYYKDEEELFMVPIWNKCIWALGKIGTPKAVKCIKEFRNSPYEWLRKTVETQYELYGWTD